jgi:23S rRNA pseudouridine1911/1915/1917 synthase
VGSVSEHRFEVSQQDAGSRLDVFLSRMDLELSRNQVQRFIENNHIQVNGQPQKASYRLRPGEQVSVYLPPPPPPELTPEPLPLQIIFEDEHLIGINKPPGLWFIRLPATENQPWCTVSSIIVTTWLIWEGH